MIYVVKPGDSLSSIAETYGVSVDHLRIWNGKKHNYLVVGEALWIALPKEYTIKSGDTLTSIAEKYGLTLPEILARNPGLSVLNTLEIGQTLSLRKKQRKAFLNGFAPTFSSCKDCASSFTSITHFSYSPDENGVLRMIGENNFSTLLEEVGVLPFLCVTNTTEKGGFSTSYLSKLFASKEKTDTMISSIVKTCKERGYQGVNIDFEYISPKDKEKYLSFLRELKSSLSVPLAVSLAPKTKREQKGTLYEAHDYASVGEIADMIILMTYEWGYQYGPAMPVAPLDRVKEVLDYAVQDIPSEKILIGIPNYGYDYTLPFEKGSRAKALYNIAFPDYARQKKASISYLKKEATPYFRYYDEQKKEHLVYFEDVRSVREKCRLVEEYKLKGLSVWTIPACNPPMLKEIASWFTLS